MSNKQSVAIVGMCKNVEEHLEKNVFKTLNEIKEKFGKVYLYIFTNDNTDNTLTLLEKYKKDNENDYEDITIENETPLKDKSLHRQNLTILVYGRNKCLEYARSKNVDYMCMCDLDNVLFQSQDTNIDDMLEFINKNDNVVSISKADKKDCFYDKFSYRTERFNRCMFTYKDHSEWWGEVLQEEFTKVNSYFGGMCFYKMKLIPNNARYDRKDKQNRNCCEHVAFNEMLNGEHYLFCNNFK
jgi:hypothetical protein